MSKFQQRHFEAIAEVTQKGKYLANTFSVDPNETKDLAAERPDDLARLKAALEAWQESVRRSNDGADYRQAG